MDTKAAKTIRKNRVRAKISGSAQRPRLSVYISNKHAVAQLIDDVSAQTLVYMSTVGVKELADKNLTEKASWLGDQIGRSAAKKKIKRVVFDRGGKKYHGRAAALAEAARKAGLQF